ncbi:MAG: DUF1588 domain-containing protein [Gammaproteobacteria bacterium]|nr:DUF1588 domain-containing protein [Gammaproteobacteria bacterium]
MKFFAQTFLTKTKFALLGLVILNLISACSGGSDGEPANKTPDNLPVSVIAQNHGRLGAVVLLDGTSSSASADKLLTYKWSFKSLPEDSQAIINNANRPIARFIPDVLGDFVVQLIVNDGNMDSVPTIFTFTIIQNRPPVANPGTSKAVDANTVIQLDGSNSKDEDGDVLKVYRWKIMLRPSESTATLNNTNIVNPSFYADLPGEYEIQLVVGDGQALSAAETITLTTTTTNATPVAYAGIDATVITGTPFTLNGGGSIDTDNDTLTFQWILSNRPAGSNAILNNTTSITPSFSPDIDGKYDIELTVNDGKIDSLPVNVVITSQTPVAGNNPPIADAGNNAEIAINTSKTLSGQGSDADSDPLTYLWRFVSIPPRSSSLLLNEQTATPSFTADFAGIYIAELIVNDGKINSNPKTVTITATDPNTPPVANAGANIEVEFEAGALVNLNGSGTDVDPLDVLTYKWAFILKPLDSTATLNNTTIANPQFTPDKAGNYIAQLVVNDGKLDSNPKTVIIAVNTKPSADAGDAKTANTNTLVTLDGSASFDPDGDDLTYQWEITLSPGSTPALNNATTSAANFTPLNTGTYTVQLIVNDGKIASTASTVNIEVNTIPIPIANPGVFQTVDVNSVVTLDGSASSGADGDNLTYQWVIISSPGTAPTLNDANTVTPNFTPLVTGRYIIQLIVNDGKANSMPDSVTITVATTTAALCSTLKNNEFLNNTWPVLKDNCLRCHTNGAGGVTSDLNFAADAVAGFNGTNFDMFKNISTKKDGNNVSTILTKAANTNGDHSGGALFSVTDARYTTLSDMVGAIATCIADTPNQASVVLNTRYERLRKSTLALTSRLPTALEENRVMNAANDTVLESEMNSILDTLLTQNAFYDRLKVIYNDLLLTNAFPVVVALNSFALGNFNSKDYFTAANLDAQHTPSERNRIRKNANYGLVGAPLELIAHVVRQNRSFTEILTANYAMVNPYSARLRDVTFADGFEFSYQETITSNNPNSYREAKIIDRNGRAYPHAGILTTLVFLTRYPSTKTNLNRARARIIFKYFLDTDVEGLADRSGLDLDNIIGTYPTLEDPQCKQCHDVIDPIAGTFKNWDDRGRHQGNRTDWPNTLNPPEFLPPGFSMTDLLPSGRSASALQWLASRIVVDNRFALSTVKTMFTGLTGKQPTTNETALIENLKTNFKNSNFNLKILVKDIVNSTTFRASNLIANENPALFTDVGAGRLLTPEQLDNKIQAVTGGYRWQSPSNKKLSDLNTYNVLYGGINSSNITTRITDQNSIMSGVQKRVAMQTSCETVPEDFKLAAADRHYFPFVEIADTPGTADTKIRQNIQYLHKLILGEVLAINDPEVTRSMNLFTSIWNATSGNNIPTICRGTLDTANPITVDTNHTVRSWMAFVSYLLLDYKFLYE